MSDIFQTVRLNEIDNYNSLIALTDVNIINPEGLNLLHAAIAHKNTAIGLDLVKRGVNVEHQDKNGQAPLHYAGLYRNPEIANAILSNGGDANLNDLHGNNPLWTAVFNSKGDYETVKVIMANGGDVLSKNKHGRSPLDFANQIKDQELISLLELVL